MGIPMPMRMLVAMGMPVRVRIANRIHTAELALLAQFLLVLGLEFGVDDGASARLVPVHRRLRYVGR